jgi:hypothetical protein
LTDHPTRPAPPLAFKAAVSNREIRFDQVDRPSLILMFAQETSNSLDPVIESVRAEWPHTRDLAIFNVVDLRSIPRLIRKMAEIQINSSYQNWAKNLEAGEDAADWVYILPDWDGETLKALGLSDVSKQVAVAAVGPDGRLAGPYQGDAPGPAAVELVKAIAG